MHKIQVTIGRVTVKSYLHYKESVRLMVLRGIDDDEADFDLTITKRQIPRLLTFIKKAFPDTFREWHEESTLKQKN